MQQKNDFWKYERDSPSGGGRKTSDEVANERLKRLLSSAEIGEPIWIVCKATFLWWKENNTVEPSKLLRFWCCGFW